jgi:hypothetical protein
MLMTIVSAFSFGAGLWFTNNTIEFWVVCKQTVPVQLTGLMVLAWVVFAWTCGLFG